MPLRKKTKSLINGWFKRHPFMKEGEIPMSTPHEMLKFDWDTNPRWQGITRPYSPEDVLKLRNSIKIEYTLAKLGAERLWRLLRTEDYVNALGAMTGNQAVQQVHAGLKAIYVSGWQTAADAN